MVDSLWLPSLKTDSTHSWNRVVCAFHSDVGDRQPTQTSPKHQQEKWNLSFLIPFKPQTWFQRPLRKFPLVAGLLEAQATIHYRSEPDNKCWKPRWNEDETKYMNKLFLFHFFFPPMKEALELQDRIFFLNRVRIYIYFKLKTQFRAFFLTIKQLYFPYKTQRCQKGCRYFSDDTSSTFGRGSFLLYVDLERLAHSQWSDDLWTVQYYLPSSLRASPARDPPWAVTCPLDTGTPGPRDTGSDKKK